MKKLTAILLTIGLLCMLSVPAMAASEPVITCQPQNPTYNAYATAIYTVTAHGTNLSCTWYLEFEGNTYNICDTGVAIQPWEGYAGETYGMLPSSTNGSFTTFAYHFGGIGPELDGARIYAQIENGHFEITSAKSAIRVVEGVGTPPEIKVPAGMEVFQDERLELYCDATDPVGGQLSYLWYETATGELENIIAINRGSEDGDTLLCDTGTTGTRYYVCAVTTSNGGSAYSAVIPVTVLEKSNDPVLYTQDSTSVIGGTMTVDIEAMTDYDARVWNAFLERDVQYQWYLDGSPIGDATASLKMLEEYEGHYIHVAVTCYDLVFRGEAFVVTKSEPPATDDPTIPEETEPAAPPTQPDPTEPAVPPTQPDPTEPTEPPTESTQSTSPPVLQDDAQSRSGMPWWGIVLIAVAGVAFGAAGTIFFTSRKKRK